MGTIITDNFKLEMVKSLVSHFNNADNNIYIGVGKSEPWNDSSDAAPVPLNNEKEIRNFRNGLQSIKKVFAVSGVIPRVNWTSGTVYSQYDDTQIGRPSPPNYVMNTNHHVYMCLRTGRNKKGETVVSTVMPTNSNNDPFETADGYVWKFLYTISALEADQFLTASFMPTRYITSVDSNSSGVELKQYEIQRTARPGRITSFVMESGGIGYDSNDPPTVLLVKGNGDSSHVVSVFIESGRITKLEMDADSSTLAYGDGYEEGVDVVITGGVGSGAMARAVISPAQGIGYNAMADLKTDAFAMHVKIEGDDQDFIVGNDFRQIGIIANPKKNQAIDSDFTDQTGTLLRAMKLNNVSYVFTTDNRIKAVTGTQAEAFVDRYNDSDKILYYHQTPATGFINFDSNDVIDEVDGNGLGNFENHIIPEVKPFTGDVLYINNRASIIRSSTQTEDVKIILQL